MEDTKSELLTVGEAAALLRLQPSTIRAWLLKRTVTYLKVGRALKWLSAPIRPRFPTSAPTPLLALIAHKMGHEMGVGGAQSRPIMLTPGVR